MKWLNVLFLIQCLGLQNICNGNICEDAGEKTRNLINECLREGKIDESETFQCHTANSLGDCDTGERPVRRFTMMNKLRGCASIQCIKNKDKNGTTCGDGLVNYRGLCVEIGWKYVCEGEGKGRWLYADLYGSVVELNGICYPEYSKGPCRNDERLEVKECTSRYDSVSVRAKSRLRDTITQT